MVLVDIPMSLENLSWGDKREWRSEFSPYINHSIYKNHNTLGNFKLPLSYEPFQVVSRIIQKVPLMENVVVMNDTNVLSCCEIFSLIFLWCACITLHGAVEGLSYRSLYIVR